MQRVNGQSEGRKVGSGGDPRLEASRAKLLDLTLRNRLLSFPQGNPDFKERDSRLHKNLPVAARLDVVWKRLVDEEKEVLIAVRPEDADKATRLLGQGQLLSPNEEEHLEKRLQKLYREQETLQSSTGDSAFFLALGFLEWQEAPPKAGKSLFAPLLLLHVRLNRRASSAGGKRTFALEMDADAHQGNPSLKEKLRLEHNFILPDCEDAETIESYLQRVTSCLAEKPNWKVHRSAALGFFNFAGYRLWLDLDPMQWPDGSSPSEHAIVRDLVEQRWEDGAEPLPTDADTARHQVENDLPVVLEADGTQYAALLAAERGRSLVIIGPPGSGKSQTITNLIGVSLARGKRVLFVAQKVAALQVVQRLLHDVGLGPFCLALHSDHGKPRDVHEQLRIAGHVAKPPKRERYDRTITASAKVLNETSARLSRPSPDGRPVAELLGDAAALRAQAEEALGSLWDPTLLNIQLPSEPPDEGWIEDCERSLETWCRGREQAGTAWAGWQPLDLYAMDVRQVEVSLAAFGEAVTQAALRLDPLPKAVRSLSLGELLNLLQMVERTPLPGSLLPALLRSAWQGRDDQVSLLRLERALADYHRQRQQAARAINPPAGPPAAFAEAVRSAAAQLGRRLAPETPLGDARSALKKLEGVLHQVDDLIAATVDSEGTLSLFDARDLSFGGIAWLHLLPPIAKEPPPAAFHLRLARVVASNPHRLASAGELADQVDSFKALQKGIDAISQRVGTTTPAQRTVARASFDFLASVQMSETPSREAAAAAERLDALAALTQQLAQAFTAETWPTRSLLSGWSCEAWAALLPLAAELQREELTAPASLSRTVVQAVVSRRADVETLRQSANLLSSARQDAAGARKVLPHLDVVPASLQIEKRLGELIAVGAGGTTPEKLGLLTEAAKRVVNRLKRAEELCVHIAQKLGQAAPRTLTDIRQLSALATAVREMPALPRSGVMHGVSSLKEVTRIQRHISECRSALALSDELSPRFALNDLPSAEDINTLRKTLRSRDGSWLRWLSSEYRTARRKLATFTNLPRPADGEAVRLLDQLEALVTQRAALAADRDAATMLGPNYAGEKTDWEGVEPVLHWLKEYYETHGGRPAPLKQLAAFRDKYANALSDAAAAVDAAQASLMQLQGDELWQQLHPRQQSGTGELTTVAQSLLAFTDDIDSVLRGLQAVGVQPDARLIDIADAFAAEGKAAQSFAALQPLAPMLGEPIRSIDLRQLETTLDWLSTCRNRGINDAWIESIAENPSGIDVLQALLSSLQHWQAEVLAATAVWPITAPAVETPEAYQQRLRNVAQHARAVAGWSGEHGTGALTVAQTKELLAAVEERDRIEKELRPWSDELQEDPSAIQTDSVRTASAWIGRLLNAGVPPKLLQWMLKEPTARPQWWRELVEGASGVVRSIDVLRQAGLTTAEEVAADVELRAWRSAAVELHAEMARAYELLARHATTDQVTVNQVRIAADALAYANRLADELADWNVKLQIESVTALTPEQVAAHRCWVEAARPLGRELIDWLVEGDIAVHVERLDEAFRAIANLKANQQALRQVMESFGRVAGLGPGEILSEQSDLSRLQVAVNGLTSVTSRLLPWAEVLREEARARGLGLSRFLDMKGSPAVELLQQAFRAAVSFQMARVVWSGDPVLKGFNGTTHEKMRMRFARADASQLERNRELVIEATLSAGSDRLAADEMHPMLGLLAHEENKRKRHLPVRVLVERAGPAIQAYCPCWLMTPSSLAQFASPGSVDFDLIIMDEASQLAPEDAWGAIARGSQLVVVGDPKQMPPSDFFSASTDEDDENNGDDGSFTPDGASLDSILDTAKNCMRQSDLRWHYRSLHQSLIAPANRFSYNDRLILFPSPHDTHPAMGVRYHYVSNATATTGSVVNSKEAAAIVDRLVALAQAEQAKPKGERFTFGVVAMNKSQMDCIQEMIDGRRAKDAAVDRAIGALEEDSAEPLFVKNLENIQGDQRDVILISYTYAPHVPGGTPTQRFGPLGHDGGERRFNVLITRSKWRMEVFASLKSAQIVTEGKKPGIAHFQQFLEYAESGTLVERGSVTGRATDSPFEDHVIAVLRKAGYEVVPQVGVAGYFVDLAVRNPHDPARFLIGVECDGATYHSSKAARDRDRLREKVLHDRGWQLYRIWSTDWFTNHAAARDDLLTHIAKLRDAAAPVAAHTTSS